VLDASQPPSYASIHEDTEGTSSEPVVSGHQPPRDMVRAQVQFISTHHLRLQRRGATVRMVEWVRRGH
jgi:hypothetical protein